MKPFHRLILSVLAPVALTFAAACAHAAGFQHAFAADPGGKPLEIGIWYPSAAPSRPLPLGPTTMSVAPGAPIDGQALPLVVISHGTGGSFLDHHDTAIALADAGYVVVAVTHAGDNYADHSRSAYVMDRPAQIRRVIDHMLSVWDGRASIDPARIGMFGFSAGGFTTLVSIGGHADLSKVAPMCRAYPQDFACRELAKMPEAGKAAAGATPAADARIKAAVVAAPALGFTFASDGLKDVAVPVQLWAAEDDVVLPPERFAHVVRQALPGAPDYRPVKLAGHFDFLAPCSAALAQIAPPICQSNPGFDRAAFHADFNTALVAFFDRVLKPR